MVRAVRPARFWASLFTPKTWRERAWILYALAIEIETIPAKAPDPNIRAIRYQWWYDHIDQAAGVAGDPSFRAGHPVLTGLMPLLAAAPALRPACLALIEAHEKGQAESIEKREEFVADLVKAIDPDQECYATRVLQATKKENERKRSVPEIILGVITDIFLAWF
jgi:phytoene/squalene synthetase